MRLHILPLLYFKGDQHFISVRVSHKIAKHMQYQLFQLKTNGVHL